MKLISMSVRDLLLTWPAFTVQRLVVAHERDLLYLHVHSAKKCFTAFSSFMRTDSRLYIQYVDLCMFVGPRVWAGFYCFTQSHLQPGSYNVLQLQSISINHSTLL